MSFDNFSPSTDGTGINQTLIPNSANRARSELYTDYDKYAPGAKTLYVFFGTFVVVFHSLAIIALRRAKKIPYACKLLCTGILIYELSFITISTVRKFIQDPTTNLAFQVAGSVSYHLSIISVMMMSVERYLLFYYPMRYLKIVTGRLTRLFTFSTWILYLLSFVTVRYGVCYLKLKSDDVFKQAGVCNNIIVAHLGISLFCTSTVSVICNLKVLILIRAKRRIHSFGTTFPSMSNILRSYKSTGLVLANLIVLLVTSSMYGAILLAVRFFNLGVLQLRVAFESVSFLNCSLDPVLYIFWFKECQLELLKMFACFSRRLGSIAEEMRMDIFGIVIAEKNVMPKANETDT